MTASITIPPLRLARRLPLWLVFSLAFSLALFSFSHHRNDPQRPLTQRQYVPHHLRKRTEHPWIDMRNQSVMIFEQHHHDRTC